MQIVEILLVGGPADGDITMIEGDPMNPPLTYVLRQPSFGSDLSVTAKCLVYRREVSKAVEGPLWAYEYDASL